MTNFTISPSGQDGPDPRQSAYSDRYDLLADEQRRRVVAALDRVSTPTGIEALAASVVAGAEDDPEDVPDDRVERLAIELHHRHLPKLADAGLVAYDAEAHQVESVAVDGLLRRESTGK